MTGMITTKQGRTVRAGKVDLFVTEAGQGDLGRAAPRRRPGRHGPIELLPQHRSARTAVPRDRPGHAGIRGLDERVDQSDPFGFLAGSIRALLDALEIERAHLVGNSYGGAAALRLALDTPELNRMVLMGPGGIGNTRALPTEGLKSLLGYYRGGGPSRQKLEKFIRKYLVFDGDAVPDDLIDLRYGEHRCRGRREPLRRPSGLSAPRTLWRMDFTRDRRLGKLKIPTLVVWGMEDKVNHPRGGRTLAATVPNCALLEVPQAGHWVQWERADLFNDAVVRFLGDA